MRFLGLCTLIMLITAPCMARPYLLTDNYGSEQLENRNFSFGSGYTVVKHFDYTVKITAEQRFSDKELLVIAFPQAMDVSFHIERVQIGKAPHFNLQGAVAKVEGTFRARVNMSNPIRTHMMVPVQIAPVNEFTVSANEALVQGNQFFQKKLPHMVTGNEP